MSAVPLLCAVAAFLSFAAATDRRHRQRFGRSCPRNKMLLLLGGAAIVLVLGLIASITVWGPVFGPIGWVGTASLGSAMVFLGLNFR